MVIFKDKYTYIGSHVQSEKLDNEEEGVIASGLWPSFPLTTRECAMWGRGRRQVTLTNILDKMILDLQVDTLKYICL